MPETILHPLEAYRDFVYTISDRFLSVRWSTLVLYTISSQIGVVKGDLDFGNGITLRVAEQVDFAAGRIVRYGYKVSRGGEVLYWYDPQPHPNDPTLTSTFPHHKHIPPNIKHNRVPAPGLSFDRPNLPFLIEEIERDLLAPSS